MKRTFLFLIGIILSISGFAYDFEKDGFYYNITSLQNLTVELTFGDVQYTGDIVIPESVFYSERTFAVTRLGDYVFQGCSGITSIEIPTSITTTGAYTFRGCNNLTTLRIPSSIIEIGNSSACSDPGRYCFSGCTKLEHLIFEDGKTSTILLHPNAWISGSASSFVNCRLSTLYIGRNIECLLRDYADYCNPFYKQTNLKEIKFGKSVNTIISRMFQGCSSLEHIDIPGNITSIESNAFLDCTMLRDLNLQEGLITIGADAFKNCKTLKKVIIPNSVVEISNEAFLNCTGINKVFSLNTNPCRLAENAFSGATYLNATLYVPVGAKSKYEMTEGWKDFASIIETDNFDNIVNYYSANITVSKGGRILCNGISVTNTCMATTIKAEEDLNLQIIPDEGCRLVSLTVGDNDVTNMVVDGMYTVKNVQSDIKISATFEVIPIALTIQHADNGYLKQFVQRGANIKFAFVPSQGWKINTVMFNGYDITSELGSNNEYTTPAINADAMLSVSFESTQNAVNSAQVSMVKVYGSSNGEIVISGAERGDVIYVYDESGKATAQTIVNGYEQRIAIQAKGIYIVKVNGKIVKVCL